MLHLFLYLTEKSLTDKIAEVFPGQKAS